LLVVVKLFLNKNTDFYEKLVKITYIHQDFFGTLLQKKVFNPKRNTVTT